MQDVETVDPLVVSHVLWKLDDQSEESGLWGGGVTIYHYFVLEYILKLGACFLCCCRTFCSNNLLIIVSRQGVVSAKNKSRRETIWSSGSLGCLSDSFDGECKPRVLPSASQLTSCQNTTSTSAATTGFQQNTCRQRCERRFTTENFHLADACLSAFTLRMSP